jgi:hypothetical protein
MRRGLGLTLAFLLAAGAIAYHERRFADPHVQWDRFDLPAFDAYVYMAMAEAPALFTVAPWGYRVLTPWLAGTLPVGHTPVGNTARAFRYVTWGGLVAAGVLLFAYLRRRGHAAWAALLGVAAFGWSGPVAGAVHYRFLVEPVTVALEVAFLLALESGAGLGVLALAAGLGALSKEFFLFLLPLVYLIRRTREGDRRALLSAAWVAAPAVVATLVLRFAWTPYLAGGSGVGLGLFASAARRMVQSWSEWAPPLLLGGLAPLALLACFRRLARPRLLGDLYLVAVALLPPFFNPVTFFPADVPRLLLYALPALIPLALLAMDRLLPNVAEGGLRGRWPRWSEWVGWAGAAATVIVPLVALDSYRRLDLRGPRDGPYLLTLCREARRTAGRLARSQHVTFDAETQRFDRGASHPSELSRMRWFLRDGWGDQAHYGSGPIAAKDRLASLMVPVFEPRDLDLELALAAPEARRVTVTLNGQPIDTVEVGTEAAGHHVRLPAAFLFRGDNLVVLSEASGVVLRALTLRPGG